MTARREGGAGGSTIRERRLAQEAAKQEAFRRKQQQLSERQKVRPGLARPAAPRPDPAAHRRARRSERAQRHQEAAAAEEDARFRAQLAEVAGAVAQRSGVLGQVDALLEAQAAACSSQAAQLHQRWTQQVFDTIQVRRWAARDQGAAAWPGAGAGQPCALPRAPPLQGRIQERLAGGTITAATADILDPLRGDLARRERELAQVRPPCAAG
jgi:hypothetical protein